MVPGTQSERYEEPHASEADGGAGLRTLWIDGPGAIRTRDLLLRRGLRPLTSVEGRR